MREPGARLVPGAVDSAGLDGPSRGGHHFNGGAHRSDDGDDEVASAAEFDTGGRTDSAARSGRRPRKHQQPFRWCACRAITCPRDQRNR